VPRRIDRSPFSRSHYPNLQDRQRKSTSLSNMTILTRNKLSNNGAEIAQRRCRSERFKGRWLESFGSSHCACNGLGGWTLRNLAPFLRRPDKKVVYSCVAKPFSAKSFFPVTRRRLEDGEPVQSVFSFLSIIFTVNSGGNVSVNLPCDHLSSCSPKCVTFRRRGTQFRKCCSRKSV